MKIMSKPKIIRKNSIKNVLNEKNLLSKLHNPFLVNMIFSFQDNDNLYLIMDLLLGGDLRYHLNKSEIFNEIQLKFFLSCVISGLNYLHNKKIIHKDIKPENLVFDINGYLHITDLGISKIYHEENSEENSGTPGYMAPEVLFNKNHDYSVDFFALGVIGYEIIMRQRPYLGKDKKELRKEIINKQAKLNKEEILIRGWSNTCTDFINNLLQRKKEKRLGYNGIKELKEHLWYKNFNWDDLINKKMEPNWKPPYEENYYHNYKDEEKIGKETELFYKEIKTKEDYQKYFLNYTFNNIDLNSEEKIGEKISEKKEEKEYENKKMKIRFEITSKIIKKLKEEIKKFSVSQNRYKDNKDKKSNILYKNQLQSSILKSKNFLNKNLMKSDNLSLRFNKSYYLYNFNSKDKNSRKNFKLYINNDSFGNTNALSSLNNLSTKYNSKERNMILNIEKYNSNEKKLNKSLKNNKFFEATKYSTKPKINFSSTKNQLFINKMNFKKLPVIKPMKKSSSVVNFNNIRYNQKQKFNFFDIK